MQLTLYCLFFKRVVEPTVAFVADFVVGFLPTDERGQTMLYKDCSEELEVVAGFIVNAMVFVAFCGDRWSLLKIFAVEEFMFMLLGTLLNIVYFLRC